PLQSRKLLWVEAMCSSFKTGKTRTREKYRVVYTDHQRLELEKEFHYNRYITIRRKSELAANLRLSERQVKIWFQNRRAKERKLMKKKMTHFDGSNLGSMQSDSGSVSPMPLLLNKHYELPVHRALQYERGHLQLFCRGPQHDTVLCT
uniref:Homeobox domain-containing protein n=1 Tax=Pavo cristatus TaxID=9049 RepID=A0A8C9LFZ9_PAVCR